MISIYFKHPRTPYIISGVFAVSSLLFFSCDQKSTSDQPVLQSEATLANIQSPTSPANETLEFLRLQAEAGRTAQQYKYAYYLTIHQQQPSDLVVAKDWFQKAAESGHIEAAYRLGVIHAEALIDGVPNLHEAINWFLKAATEGHSGAQFELGRYCLHGEGVTKSPQKALAWLQLAAHQYHSGAQYLLGRMYESGNGVTLSLELAYKWYKLAADSGHPAALYKVAVMAESGRGTTLDSEIASNYYSKAYAQGLPGKQSQTVNIARNVVQAPNLLSSQNDKPPTYTNAGPAGPEGTPASVSNRTVISKSDDHSNTSVGSKPSPVKVAISSDKSTPTHTESISIEEISSPEDSTIEEDGPDHSDSEVRASSHSNSENRSISPENNSPIADKGNPEVLHRIAMEFLNPPRSQTPDYTSAITYFEKAAAKGHSPSQYQLAEIYYHGEHSKPNYSQAFIWYSLAANNQISKAQFRLGSMYYEGKGVEKNTDKAKRWLHLAASQDSQTAISLLQVIHQQEQLRKSASTTPKTEQINLSAQNGISPVESSPSPMIPQRTVTPKLTPEDWFKKGFALYTSEAQPSQETYMEAYQNFVRAANQNYGDAWYYIGKMYDYGEGLKVNPVKAFECYLVAAREGNPNAQYSLGFMYETGLGCRKNTSEAYVWYALAAENGLSNANQTKIGLENKMSVGEIGYAKKRLTTLREYLRNYKQKAASN